MPTARASLVAATGSDGRIYAIGGDDLLKGLYNDYLDTVAAYGPATNSWTAVAPMPTPREQLAAVAGRDGRIYAIGGQSPNHSQEDIVEAYNPSNNTWVCSQGDSAPGCSSTSLAPMPTGRFALTAAVGSDGRIYAIGGSPQ
jgi:N-acetylneuraminic acid mutarotase